jgi:hypothetical protein
MRTKDSILLEDAYVKARVLQEARFRDIAAAAALGLSAAKAGMTPDDLADKHGMNPPIVQQAVKHEEPVESNYHKAKVAYDKAVKERKADESLLKDIALDTDLSKRFAGHLVLQGLNVPDIIRKASDGYADEFKRAASSQNLE